MKVVMPYPGRCLSVNYYRIRVGKRLTTRIRPEVKLWMEDLAQLVKSKMGGEDLGKGVVVQVYGKFCDGRVPDLDNLAKVVLDAIKMGTGVDDRYMEFRTLGYSTGWTKPVLEIDIEGC